MTSYLNHVTLNTRHRSKSPRDRYEQYAIDATRDLIADAIAAGGDADMPVPGYRLHVEPFGDRRAALMTVYAGKHPLMTMGVAKRRLPALWRQLHEFAESVQPGAIAHSPEPEAPWCAVLLLPAVYADFHAASWLGSFEAIAAWAWVGRGPGEGM